MERHDEFEGRPGLVRKRAQAEFLSRVMTLAMIVLLAIILVLVLISIRANNEDKDNLLSCTTPSGDCYKQSQKQSGVLINDLVSRINKNSDLTRTEIVLALWCDGQPGVKTVDDMVGCINEGMKTYGHLPIRGEETDPARKQ